MPRSNGPSRSRSPESQRRRRRDRSRDAPKRRSERDRRNDRDREAPSGANYGLSGKLNAASAQDTARGYTEPPEARRPVEKWRFFVFKGRTQVDTVPLYRRSAVVFGRDRATADYPVDHESCSGRHAVVQFRAVAQGPEEIVRPYVIDLESTNGTFVNGERIPAARYVELRPEDVVRLGESTREYVLLHDGLAKRPEPL